MKQFIISIKNNENVKIAYAVLKIVVMMLAIVIYLLEADLSTAPEFIYNQF